MTKEELKQYIDDNIYENQDGEITGESLNAVLKAIVDDGGTEVEANPTGTPTETMQTIKIGETIYEIPEGIPTDMDFDQKLQTQANINNQESSVAGRLGYVVLQPEKQGDATTTFAAQIANKPNTIFEIRDVFDLDGSNVTIPANCTLKFNGGKLLNGNVLPSNGDDVRVTGDIGNSDVFTVGYNILIESDTVYASKIGMLQGNTANSSSVNSSILDRVIASGKKLFVDGEYYIGGSHEVNGDFFIFGDGIAHFTENNVFKMAEESSLHIEDLTIYYESYLITSTVVSGDNARHVDYAIDGIYLLNAKFYGERLIDIRATLDDVISGDAVINDFIVKGNYFKCTVSAIILTNIPTENGMVCDNTIDDMVYGFLNYGVANSDDDKDETVRSMKKTFIVRNNNVKGKCFKSDSQSYTCFVLAECSEIYYENNNVSNIINIGYLTDTEDGSEYVPNSGQNYVYPTYDSYLSCEVVHYNGNTIKNVIELPWAGHKLDVMTEFFKSKAGGLRYIDGNDVSIDFAECRAIVEEQLGHTWTEEEFDNISDVTMFIFPTLIPKLIFSNNKVTVKNGTLNTNVSDGIVKVESAVLYNNYFDIEQHIGSLLPYFNSDARERVFKNNTVKGYLNVFASYVSYNSYNVNCRVNISDNSFENLYPIRFNCKEVVMEGNDISNYAVIAGVSTHIGEGEFKITWDSSSTRFDVIYPDVVLDIIVNNNIYPQFGFDEDGYFEITKDGYETLKYYICIEESDGVSYARLYKNGVFVAENSTSTSIYVYKSSDNKYAIKLYKYGDRASIVFEDTTGIPARLVYKKGDKYQLGTYDKGVKRFDEALGKEVVWNGSNWIDSDGSPADTYNNEILVGIINQFARYVDFGNNLVFIDNNGLLQSISSYQATEANGYNFPVNYPNAKIVYSIGEWSEKSATGSAYNSTGCSYFSSGSSANQNISIQEVYLTIPDTIACVRRMCYNMLALQKAVIVGGASVTNLEGAFQGNDKLKSLTLSITGKPHTLKYLLYQSLNVVDLDVSSIDASYVYDLQSLVAGSEIKNLLFFKSGTVKVNFSFLYHGNLTVASVQSIIDSLYDFASNPPSAYDSTATYSIGDLVTNDSKTYICNTAITIAEAFNSTKWVETTKNVKISNNSVSRYNVGKTTGVDDCATVIAAKGWSLN